MSLRRSVGELVPHDVAAILAREKHAGKGRKRRGGSLSRAFNWLKGRRKKKTAGGGSGGKNGQARAGLVGIVGEGRAGKHAHQNANDNGKGAPRQEDERRPVLSQQYPDNVFIEGSRPQYLEDLHSEAQEGLKILQQEENGTGVDYLDDESITVSISSMVTLQPDDDASVADSVRTVRSGDTTTDAMSTISAVSTVSAVSTRSTRSTRSGLTRQGSTFKPLNAGRRPEKTRRRGKRATVMGIPQHVQRELGLDRGAWQRPDEQLPNGEDEGGILAEDGEALPDPEGVRVHLAALEALEESQDEQQLLRRHVQALYWDDLALARSAGPRLSPCRRPKSLAVPGLVTSAVATNPPASLLPTGPVMYISPQATYLSKIIPNAVLPPDVDVIEISRGRNQSSVRTLSKSSLTSPSPALSRVSSSSCWSDSQSSDTVVSDSSTISGGGGGRSHRRAEAWVESGAGPGVSLDQVSLHSSVSCMSNMSNITSVSQAAAVNGRARKARRGDVESLHDDGDGGLAFGRSLSVMKTRRKPPAPPRRTNSLHPNKLRRRSRELVDAPVFSGSPAYSADESRSITPVSSISPPTQSAAGGSSNPSSSSPQGSGLDGTISPSSGYSSQGTTPTQSSKTTPPPSPGNADSPKPLPAAPVPSTLVQHGAKASILGQPLDIPPPPRVKAPTPPPPETWIHDQRSFNLLCGPKAAARNIFVALQKRRLEKLRDEMRPQVVEAGTAASAASGSETTRESLLDQKKESPPVMSQKSGSVKAEVEKVLGSLLARTLTQAVEVKNHASLTGQKKEPPPVMKKSSPAAGKKEADRRAQESLISQSRHTLSMDSPVLPRVSPPPSPPPAHHPPPPPAKQTPPSSVSSPESSWPLPPPPPMELLLGQVFEGQGEVDFPPPPPPQDGVVSPLTIPVRMLAAETLVTTVTTISTLPAPAPQQQLAREVAPPTPESVPAAMATATMAVTLEIVPPGPSIAQPNESQEPAPVPKESPPPSQESGPAPKKVPPPPQEPAPVPKEVPPPLQEPAPVPKKVPPPPQEPAPEPKEVPPPPQEPVPVPKETPPPPQEPSPVPKETPLSPREPTPVPKEVPPPPQEPRPVPKEAPPPPQEPAPIPKQVLPSPQEPAPVPKEVPFPPLESAPVQKETLPPPQEPAPGPKEVPPSPQEPTPVPKEVPLSPQESAPVPKEVSPPPQEPAPVPKEVLLPPQEPTPVTNETLPPSQEPVPVPQEVSPSLPAVTTAASPATPPPVEKQAPLTSPVLAKEDTKPGHGGDKWGQKENQIPKQRAPQKPRPLSITAPSMRLQEAIRMKTAAMSRRDSPATRLSSRSSHSPSPSPSPSAASTASFIFSKSAKKVVIETPSSPEAQFGLKKNLSAELVRVTDPTKTARVPPPVARKPSQHAPTKPATPTSPTTPTKPTTPTELVLPTNPTPPIAENAGEQAQPKDPNSARANPGTTGYVSLPSST